MEALSLFQLPHHHHQLTNQPKLTITTMLIVTKQRTMEHKGQPRRQDSGIVSLYGF